MKDIIFSKWVLFPSALLFIFVGSLVFFVNLKEDILAKRQHDNKPKEQAKSVEKETKPVTTNLASKNTQDFNGFSIVEKGKALGVSTTEKFDIEVGDANIKEYDKYVQYVYNVNFTDNGFTKVKNGYQYKADVLNCNDYRIFVTSSSFNGVRKSDVSKSFNIQVSIYKDFLEKINEFDDSKIEVFDLNNQKLFDGDIKIPKCYKLEEVNSIGRVNIAKPVVDGSLENHTQFVYTFNLDEKAYEELNEQGFKYKISAKACDGRQEDNKNMLDGWVSEGTVKTYNFVVKLRDDYLPDKEEEKLKLARYEISDRNDKLLFRGITYAPNCK